MIDYKTTLNQSIQRKKKIIDEEVTFYNEIPLFSWVEISPIDACNRKCEFCPKADEENFPDTYNRMDLKLIEKLKKEFEIIGFDRTVVFAGYGEPLLNKNIYKMIEILSDVCQVEVTTNGDPLNEKVIRRLINSGISKIVVSLYDGPEQIDHYNNLFLKAEAPKKKFVLRDRWYKIDDGYGLMLTNRAGTLNFKNKNLPENIENKCFYTHYSMMIDWNGDVFLCTQDWNRKIKSGNISEDKLIDIWNSELLKKFRLNLSKGLRNNSPCLNCNANGTLHGEAHVKAWEKYYKI